MSGPDWEGFGRAVMEWWPGGEISGDELDDAAVKHGLISEVPGGFDPKQHADSDGVCPSPGDPWFLLAYPEDRAADAILPEIKALRRERDEARAEAERLRGALEDIGVYGCGMLNQPAAMNAPEEVWLRKRIGEYERRARAALRQDEGEG